MPKAKILVVEDEKNIAEALKYNLAREGFSVSVAPDGRVALERVPKENPDLVLLDWMRPELDGLEVCRRLKQDDKTRGIPISLLTVRSDETDKVLGLEMGADDYVTKPFSQRELNARIKAILRRFEPPHDDVFRRGNLEVDWGRHLVTVDGRSVELTFKEFSLLKVLVEAKGRVLDREVLLDRVWGYEAALKIETRTVDLHVSQLRRKLGSASRRIRTLKSAGYRFVDDE